MLNTYCHIFFFKLKLVFSTETLIRQLPEKLFTRKQRQDAPTLVETAGTFYMVQAGMQGTFFMKHKKVQCNSGGKSCTITVDVIL